MKQPLPYLDLRAITALHAEEIRDAVSDVLSSGCYLQGERVARFESDYATFVEQTHCVTTASGFDALTIMVRAYKELGVLHDGDEVLVPANTYIATILSISENGLTPVLIEPRLETLQIDDRLLAEALSPRTRALMIVHLYGRNAYTDLIGEFCAKHNLLLLEDYAQAAGLTAAPRPSTVRNARAHSFYPTKNLGALADAGAITTNDEELARVARALINYGSSQKYVFDYRGRNSRMDELTAAVLSVKLRYLPEENARRQTIADYYNKNIHFLAEEAPTYDCVHKIIPILVPDRDALQRQLLDRGIGTAIHYPIPPHKQRCYSEWSTLSLPITEYIHAHELSLPLNQAMTDAQVEHVVSAINQIITR